MSHAGDAAIEAIKQHGKPDCLCGVVEVPRSLKPHPILNGSVDNLQDRIIAEEDISCGKQRRQHVHASAKSPGRLVALPPRIAQAVWHSASPAFANRSGADKFFLLTAQEGDDAGAAFYAIANLDLDFGRRLHQDVRARSELDQPYPLSTIHFFANLLREHNAPRQKSGDLLENYCVAFSLDRDSVLFITIGTLRIHRVQKLAFLILRS